MGTENVWSQRTSQAAETNTTRKLLATISFKAISSPFPESSLTAEQNRFREGMRPVLRGGFPHRSLMIAIHFSDSSARSRNWSLETMTPSVSSASFTMNLSQKPWQPFWDSPRPQSQSIDFHDSALGIEIWPPHLTWTQSPGDCQIQVPWLEEKQRQIWHDLPRASPPPTAIPHPTLCALFVRDSEIWLQFCPLPSSPISHKSIMLFL